MAYKVKITSVKIKRNHLPFPLCVCTDDTKALVGKTAGTNKAVMTNGSSKLLHCYALTIKKKSHFQLRMSLINQQLILLDVNIWVTVLIILRKWKVLKVFLLYIKIQWLPKGKSTDKSKLNCDFFLWNICFYHQRITTMIIST